MGGPGKASGGSVHTHILPSAGGGACALPGARVACVLAPCSPVQAPGDTLTTPCSLWCLSSPHRQCIYKASFGLGLHTFMLCFIQQILIGPYYVLKRAHFAFPGADFHPDFQGGLTEAAVLVPAHLRPLVFFWGDERTIQDQSCPGCPKERSSWPQVGTLPPRRYGKKSPQPSYLPSLRLSHSARGQGMGRQL